MPSRGCPQYHSSNGPLLGLTSRSVSVPTLCSGPPRALHLNSADMGTLASPREQLGALHPLLVASGVQLNHKARDNSDMSCCDNGDWPRSTSPAHSTHSGNSSLPSEEVVDSGVCSEHDTPPLTVRYQASRSPLHRQAASDSDCESNLSSDSLPDQCRGSRRWTPPRRTARPGGGKLTLPEALLQEIKEKWQELQHRRQQQGRVDVPERGGCGQLGTRAVASQWSAGRHAQHRRSSCPASPVLSRASSLSFPSSFSLFDEELESPRSSPVYLEGWRLMGVQRPCDHVGARALYECRDEEAGQGFAGIRDIFSPQQDSTIKSCKGTVRGVKNRVRAGIATFTTDQRITKVSVLQLSSFFPPVSSGKRRSERRVGKSVTENIQRRRWEIPVGVARGTTGWGREGQVGRRDPRLVRA
ncbi:Glutaredoxin domain-containing cysteine-rich protein [Portunus trituberculatus]|uniref:Glutaredoxin domain-containing cysteine-rich protein n=1 Tax=Portunus trituberculatus TaxID=210409 RepID=A0A5B7CWC2_PORTR|nr:Glutaredoxin domain-containing cysteine-rich protein [Portunus trituberculatus]